RKCFVPTLLTPAAQSRKLQGLRFPASKPSHFEPLMLRVCVVTIAVCLAWSTFVQAENWPQWRGLNGDGVSHEKDLPIQWTRESNSAWKLPLPGPGGATPVIWGDRIFVTSIDGSDLVLLCVNADGKQLWKQTVSTGNKDVRGDEGNSAAPSPCTDGKHVWSFF